MGVTIFCAPTYLLMDIWVVTKVMYSYLFPQFRLADNSKSIPFIEYLIRVTHSARNCESTKVIQTWYLLLRKLGKEERKK